LLQEWNARYTSYADSLLHGLAATGPPGLMASSHRGAGAIYPGGARAHPLLRVEGARGHRAGATANAQW